MYSDEMSCGNAGRQDAGGYELPGVVRQPLMWAKFILSNFNEEIKWPEFMDGIRSENVFH